MNLNRRVEKLEKQGPSKLKKSIFVIQKAGETKEETTRRVCIENGYEQSKFENGDYCRVYWIIGVKPGDV